MNDETGDNLRERLERLPDQIRRYYNVYFSELRSQLTRPDLFYEAVPDFLKGYKRVISIGGQDGLVVVHFPIETEITLSETDGNRILIIFPSVLNATEDVYDFITFPESPVADLAEFISGEEDIGVVVPTEVSHERPWGPGIVGVFNEPQRKADSESGELTWQAPWTRLVFADFKHLYFWENLEQARVEARHDIEPYVRRSEYKELDEIRAPRAIEEVGVKAGARGVVVEVFEVPRPALLVEYVDYLGQTIALAVYSTNLEETYDVLQDRDFLANDEDVLGTNEAPLEQQTIPIPAHSPPLKGLVLAA
jgi:hypothetical protein